MNTLEMESEARRFAANEIVRWLRNEPVRSENNVIYRGVHHFSTRHAFPDEATVEGLFDEEYLPLLSYPLAQRLWGAGKKESGEEMYTEVRIVRYLLGSLEKMQLHRLLVDCVLCDEDIVAGERGSHGLHKSAVTYSYFKYVIDQMWADVNGWDNLYLK